MCMYVYVCVLLVVWNLFIKISNDHKYSIKINVTVELDINK